MEPWRNNGRYVTAEALHAQSGIVQHGRACGLRYVLTANAKPPTLRGPLHED